MTESELCTIESRMEGATPGPWHYSVDSGKNRSIVDPQDHVIATDVMSMHDLRFLMHARTDLPQLLSEVRKLQSQLSAEKTYRGMLEKWVQAAHRKLEHAGVDWESKVEEALSELVAYLQNPEVYPTDKPNPLFAAERLLSGQLPEE